MAKSQETRNENLESRRLVEAAFALARSLGIEKLLVQADELRDVRFIEKLRGTERIVWLTRGEPILPKPENANDRIVSIPEVSLTRMSQLKIGLLVAVLNEHVGANETILCVSGVAGSERLDTMLITNPQRDFPWFRKYDVEKTQDAVKTQVLVRIIDVALRLAREGREGKPLGTIFVLGDMEKLSQYLRQLVLNPCKGHPQKNRDIRDDDLFETLREFAALDGAFVISNRGIMESAGTYIDAPARKTTVRLGLGSRHAAAAALTGVTESIAVVVSASSGTVTVFHEGKEILGLEKTPAPISADTERKGQGKTAGKSGT